VLKLCAFYMMTYKNLRKMTVVTYSLRIIAADLQVLTET